MEIWQVVVIAAFVYLFLSPFLLPLGRGGDERRLAQLERKADGHL